MSIDPNKIIIPFTDCQGTCKTPIGCTCGNAEEEDNADTDGQEIVEEADAIEVEVVAAIVEQDNIDIEAEPKPKRGCCRKGNRNGSSCCCSGANKLEVYNWLKDYPDITRESKMVEVQFKNTRKGYYLNSNNLELCKGDVVAVEATPGHDIGEVTLTGKLVELQMKKTNFRGDVKRVYRIAKQSDLEKYEQAKGKEHKTMLRAREIAEELAVDMKISDVEYQGDGNKAIFYYIADGRVDFRQLIKYYASEFRIKIEMKQIGARQEAGRVGGIGPCGRELCCSSSMSNFISVSTQAARIQDIPLNPQKLAGQCGKLKCCLNFEVDTYVEAQRGLPSRDIVLETKDSSYFHFKTDILSGMMSFSTDRNFAVNIVTLPKDSVFDIIKQNQKGKKPLSLLPDNGTKADFESKPLDVLEQESITRFDEGDNGDREDRRKGKKRKNNNRRNNRPQPNNNVENSGKAESQPSDNVKKVVTKQQDGNAPAEQKKSQTSRRRSRGNNRPQGNREQQESKQINLNKRVRNDQNDNKSPEKE